MLGRGFEKSGFHHEIASALPAFVSHGHDAPFDRITAGHQTIFTHPLKAESEQPFLHLRIGLANELIARLRLNEKLFISLRGGLDKASNRIGMLLQVGLRNHNGLRIGRIAQIGKQKNAWSDAALGHRIR